MDEREKAQLKQQKKIVDCIENINTALNSFDRLEEYKSRVIPIIDGLDLTHSDTYFEVTNKWIDGWCHRCFLPFLEMTKFQKSIK